MDPEYSDSVKAMNGCLGFCLEVVSIMFSVIFFLAVAPWVCLILLAWWIVAWILGLVFPGREFFPIKKIYRSVSNWSERRLGHPLGELAFLSFLTVVGGIILNGIENLFSRKS